MTNTIDAQDKDALALLLRSKTALGRLNDAEVHSVLDFLESIGFAHRAPAIDELAPPPELVPLTVIEPPPEQ